jgi:tetratricopeptide (TPR) repeat protein
MTTLPIKEINSFYCYAREDHDFCEKLEHYLTPLKRRHSFSTWFDRRINPGENWEEAVEEHLNAADLIFLLISPDFMASDYCYTKEMRRALERHARGEARVVPILLRPTYWEDMPFSGIQLLPTNSIPLTRWLDSDEAFQDIIGGIDKTIQALLALRETKETWLTEGNTLFERKRYNKALIAYEQALRLDLNYAYAYVGKGNTLNKLRRYNEALMAYEQALRLDPNYAYTYVGKGNALNGLKKYDEALAAYEQALRLDPNYALAYNNKGNTLNNLKRYDEALTAYEQAIGLDSNYALAYNNKGNTLNNLKRYDEAEKAHQKARELGYD